jgi:hypothetical protein
MSKHISSSLGSQTHIDSNNVTILSAIRPGIHADTAIRAEAMGEVHGSKSILLEDVRPRKYYILQTSDPYFARIILVFVKCHIGLQRVNQDIALEITD